MQTRRSFLGGGAVRFKLFFSKTKQPEKMQIGGGFGGPQYIYSGGLPLSSALAPFFFSNLLPMLLAHSITAICCLHKIMLKYLLQGESYEKEGIEYCKFVLYPSGGIL